jgi:hypothetical protein
MFKSSFGSKNQVSFNSESEYYEFLGYLSKNDGTTKIVWENNDEQGAWAQEGRIHFYETKPEKLRVVLQQTAGIGNINFRVNCNTFVENILHNHNFTINGSQNIDLIMKTIPSEYLEDFENGRLI